MERLRSPRKVFRRRKLFETKEKQTKGGLAEEKSRRDSGLDSIAEDSALYSTSEELKLLQMGGHGGKPRDEISEWNCFPSTSEQTRMIDNLKFSDSEREKK